MSGIEFEGVKQNPFGVGESRNTSRLVEAYMKSGQMLKDRLRPDQMEARVTINTPNDVARIMLISDLHFGSEASSIESIKEIMVELEKPDTYAILAGDLIEGIKQEYISTTTGTLLNFQEQIDTFRGLFLRKIIEKKKILALVSRYGSHDDWPSNKESLNGPSIMLDSLTLPDGSKVPLIMNGGRLYIKIGQNSPEVGIELFHKVGGSGSTINPVKPLRGVFVNKKIERNQNRPLVAMAGHNHSRAGVSSERVMAGNTEVQLVLLQGGTVKGLDDKNPDFFMVEKGNVLIRPPGAAMVLRYKEKDEQVQIVPTYGNERSRRLLEAFEVLNRSESLGLTEELRQELENEDGELQLTLDEKSEVAQRSGGQKIQSKLYRELNWRVDVGKLGLPTCVHFISHTDFGSSETDINHVDKIIEETNKSNRSGLLILNGMLASNVPRMADREDVLDEFADKMGKVSLSRRMGVMLDSILRDDAWNRVIGKRSTRNYVSWTSWPVITGDKLYFRSALKGTPLFEGGATITFCIGNNRFNILAVDGVGNFGSRQDPYLALAQMDKSSMVDNDVVTGGNSTIPGALTTSETIFIANGWNTPVKDKRYGKSSMIRVPKGGQGVIMFPNGGGKGLIYGGGSLRELNDSFTALSLHQGLLAKGEFKNFMRKGRR